MISQLLWDPYMTEEEYDDCLKDYLLYYYGDGYEYLYEYLKMQTAAGDALGTCFVTIFDEPAKMLSYKYFADNYEKMAELFDKAEALASTTKQLERVKQSRIHMEFSYLVGAYEKEYVKGNAAQRQAYKAKYDALWNYFHETGYEIGAYTSTERIPSNSNITANPYTMWYSRTYPGT